MLNQCLNFYNTELEEYDSLRYRSKAEVAIASAFDKYNRYNALPVFYLPNCSIVTPEFRCEKSTYKMESDFLVCYLGDWGLLEVDGKHHDDTEVIAKDAHKKELYKSMGIKVIERFSAKSCLDDPDSIVKGFLSRMNLVYSESNDTGKVTLPWFRILAKSCGYRTSWDWDRFEKYTKEWIPLDFDGYTFIVATSSKLMFTSIELLKKAGKEIYNLDFNIEIIHGSHLCRKYHEGLGKEFLNHIKPWIIIDNPSWNTAKTVG